MSRRPTIPLYDWRIAVHLEGAQHVQRQDGMPAVGCDCDNCVWWREIYRDVLPEKLQQQLPRFGADLDRPSDVHPYGGSEGGLYDFRVQFHTVGKILSTAGSDEQFVEIQNEPLRITMQVVRGHKLYFYTPDIPDASWGDVLCIEIWVYGVERDRPATQS
ncbi:MAG: hypothetical protein AB8G16_18620 [Gammaproteobacteria bacterium]